MGILNSDGNDRIKDQPTFPDPVRPGNVAKNPIPPTSSTDIGDTTHEGFTNQNAKTQANDLDCGVDPDLTVKLTKRPKAITCWLEKTFKSNQAVEFDLTIEVETQAIDYLQQLDERKKKVSIRPLQIPRHVHAITHNIQSIQIGSNKVYAADVVLSGSTTPLIVPQRISAQDELAYHVLIDAQQTNYLIA